MDDLWRSPAGLRDALSQLYLATRSKMKRNNHEKGIQMDGKTLPSRRIRGLGNITIDVYGEESLVFATLLLDRNIRNQGIAIGSVSQ